MKKIYTLHMISLLLTSITFQIYTMEDIIPVIPNSKTLTDDYRESLEKFMCQNSPLYNDQQYNINYVVNLLYIHNKELKRKASSDNTSEKNTSLNSNNNNSYCSQNNSFNNNPLNKASNEQINNSASTDIANFICNNQINMTQLSQQNSQTFSNNTSFTKTTDTEIFNYDKQRISDRDTDTTQIRLLCPHCSVTLASKDNLKRHLKKIHPEKQKTISSPKSTNQSLYNCHLCDKKYSRQDTLKKHIEAIHNKKQHNCPHCSNIYQYPSGLNAHLKKDHSSITFPCYYYGCHTYCLSQEKLDNHIAKNHIKKPNPCPHCGNNFSSISNLNTHIRNFHKIHIFVH